MLRTATIRAVVLAGLAATSVAAHVQDPLRGFKPDAKPFHVDGGGSAFIIRIVNTRSAPIEILAEGRCLTRVDGEMESTGVGGSSGAHRVMPGEAWQEIVRLVTWPRDPSGRRPINPWRDTVWAYRERQVQLKPGSHDIEFRCGGEWSDRQPFVWSAPPDDDVAVYRAVIAHTIRREVDRFSAGLHASGPAPILTLDKTLSICRPDRPILRGMGCVSQEDVAILETDTSVDFLPRLTRAELAKSLRERNGDATDFSPRELDGFIVTPVDGLYEALKRESMRTRGYATFSRPGYSADGHAVLEGRYNCGGLCGTNWLFVLQQRDGAWQVTLALVVSVS